MEQVEKELERLEKEIKTAEEDYGRSQGRLEGLWSRAKEEFGVDTMEGLVDSLGDVEQEVVQLEDEIKSDMEKLRKEYEW